MAQIDMGRLHFYKLQLSYYQLQLQIQLLSRMCVQIQTQRHCSIIALLPAGNGTFIRYHY